MWLARGTRRPSRFRRRSRLHSLRAAGLLRQCCFLAAAEGCPGVAEACAFAVDDPLYGQNVGVAVVVAGDGDAAVADLYRWMRGRLAETKLPARWWRVDAIPRSDRGKVSRDAVREACVGRPPLDLTRLLQGR